MRPFALLCIGVILGSSATARTRDIGAVIDALNKAAHTQVHWNIAKSRTADVTCDGHADTIVFGTDGRSVWVGVASDDNANAQALQFPATGNSEDAFAGPPLEIKISPRNCEGGEGDRLTGCKRISGCKEFSVENEADAFHFYWDNRHKIIRWWRL